MQETEKVPNPNDENKIALQKRVKATKSSADSPLIKSGRSRTYIASSTK